MEITLSGSQPSGKGPDEYFTGAVRIDPLFQAPGPARVLCQCYVRAWRPHSVAHPSARTDADRHVRLRMGTKRGRTKNGNSAGRRRLVPAE